MNGGAEKEKRLSHDTRLSGLSTRKLVREWKAVCLRIGNTVTFQGRELRAGPLLNAVVLHFMRELSEPQQEEAARKWLKVLEKMLGDGEPPSGPKTTQIPGKPRSPKR